MTASIAEKIAQLPQSPGVYLMKNTAGDIFYIGKAKSLRDRVRSYFSGSDNRTFVGFLEDILADIEVILTRSEKEALILEDTLIKKHQPRFNVKLTDDKRYLCLRLDTRQTYPRIEVVRRFAKDGARYFGPYHSATAIRKTLRLINRHFQLRTCSDQVLASRSRPCLQYQIKRCPAPCVFDLREGTYQKNVENVADFLTGRTQPLIERLQHDMQTCSDKLAFEAAALLRDQIIAIERSLEPQNIVDPKFSNRDVVGFFRKGPTIEIHVLRTRDGKMIDARRFSLDDMEFASNDIIADFAVRYYAHETDIPSEILFPQEMDWHAPLAELLSDKTKRTVHVLSPKKGPKEQLVHIACQNAKQALADKQREQNAAESGLEKLKTHLHLTHVPESMECFDISHTQGQEIVASCVRFERGFPQKSGYRRYIIRSTKGQDDFQSMYEVVSRRIRRGIEEGDLPALMVIDGGKGQLASAKAALDDHGIDHIDLIALAKAREAQPHKKSNQANPREFERIFVLGQKNPFVLGQNSAELFILTRLRDEAHRFAITHHRRRRGKTMRTSVLDSIEGIGPQRRRTLLKTFGSIDAIRQAPQHEVEKVVGTQLAQKILLALRK